MAPQCSAALFGQDGMEAYSASNRLTTRLTISTVHLLLEIGGETSNATTAVNAATCVIGTGVSNLQT